MSCTSHTERRGSPWARGASHGPAFSQKTLGRVMGGVTSRLGASDRCPLGTVQTQCGLGAVRATLDPFPPPTERRWAHVFQGPLGTCTRPHVMALVQPAVPWEGWRGVCTPWQGKPSPRAEQGQMPAGAGAVGGTPEGPGAPAFAPWAGHPGRHQAPGRCSGVSILSPSCSLSRPRPLHHLDNPWVLPSCPPACPPGWARSLGHQE